MRPLSALGGHPVGTDEFQPPPPTAQKRIIAALFAGRDFRGTRNSADVEWKKTGGPGKADLSRIRPLEVGQSRSHEQSGFAQAVCGPGAKSSRAQGVLSFSR